MSEFTFWYLVVLFAITALANMTDSDFLGWVAVGMVVIALGIASSGFWIAMFAVTYYLMVKYWGLIALLVIMFGVNHLRHRQEGRKNGKLA